MTNTLHRYSDHYALEPVSSPEPVQDDYIVFAMSSRGINDDNLVEKYRAFLRLALKHSPVNMGDATKGGIIRPRQDMNPTAHWKREQLPDAEQVIAGIDGPTTVAAVFDNYQAMKAFVDELKAADLGVSINISAPMEDARWDFGAAWRNSRTRPHWNLAPCAVMGWSPPISPRRCWSG